MTLFRQRDCIVAFLLRRLGVRLALCDVVQDGLTYVVLNKPLLWKLGAIDKHAWMEPELHSGCGNEGDITGARGLGQLSCIPRPHMSVLQSLRCSSRGLAGLAALGIGATCLVACRKPSIASCAHVRIGCVGMAASPEDSRPLG